MPEEQNHSELTELLRQNVELGCQVTKILSVPT